MDDDLDAALDELRREFVTTELGARVHALSVLVARAPTSDEDREMARRAAHMLRGTSGSYGLRELSAALTPLEQALRQPLGPATPDLRRLFEPAQAIALSILRANGLGDA
jgi:chemotaxis protein histidine kinase CheA